MRPELPMEARDKFDAALELVKEPQSELSLAELGLVSRISYFEKDKAIIAYMNFAPPSPSECPACFAIDDLLKQSIARDLRDALLAEFPGWDVEVR
ncbi:MAG: hypothetical protein KKA67_12575 [Spirochaetes bacterium]|nr:hypothetical protein [Spirochaetota bacterium]MBU1079678.1 hypothetical protein [Spirochaetota bacterium]